MSEEDRTNLLRSILAHRAFVAEALRRVAAELESRANLHDLSKLRDDEFEGFARINSSARINKFGSPEYAEGMRKEADTIDRHFRRNRHHPEHTPMTFVDVIEMVCDWWGAGKGYADSRDWNSGVELNLRAKGRYLSEGQLWLVSEVAKLLNEGEH